MLEKTTIIIASKVIGVGRDNLPLHRWTEMTETGPRTFEDRYINFTATSGQVYGVSNVFEVYPA